MDWHALVDITLGVSNIVLLALTATVKADISSVKVYMHEKFMTREEFFHAMQPPTFRRENK